jgi:hypothetical protein
MREVCSPREAAELVGTNIVAWSLLLGLGVGDMGQMSFEH